MVKQLFYTADKTTVLDSAAGHVHYKAAARFLQKKHTLQYLSISVPVHVTDESG